MTDFRYFLIYKRLALRFSLGTIERHWDAIREIIEHDAYRQRLGYRSKLKAMA